MNARIILRNLFLAAFALFLVRIYLQATATTTVREVPRSVMLSKLNGQDKQSQNRLPASANAKPPLKTQ